MASASGPLVPAVARVAAPIAFVASVAVGIQWVRFGMRTPSLIDDWFAVTYSGPALDALLHGDYGSSAVDFAGRYRPAYTALWNYAQWHLPGGPSILTAGAWGVVRVAAFLVGAWLLTAWLFGQRPTGGRWVAWLAPLAVAMTPAIAVDLASYGSGEPLMVAGLIIGLSLVAAGVRTLLNVPQRRYHALALVVVGYLVYLIGVYSKESSVALLAFIPFLLKWRSPSIHAQARRSRRARLLLGVMAVVIVAPLLHVAVHLTLAVLAGDRPYLNVELSLSTKLFAAGASPLLGVPGVLGTWLWFVAAPSAVIVTIAAARRRDRDAWLLCGILTTGFLMSSLALARGPTPSRFYIPWAVAVAAVVFSALARARLRQQLAAGLVVVVVTCSGTASAIADWARTERAASTAVELAKSIALGGCPLYLANFDVERRVALPEVFPFVDAQPIASCKANSREAFVVSWMKKPLPTAFSDRCRSAWQAVGLPNGVALHRCTSFRSGRIPDQLAASGSPLLTVVRVRLTRRIPSPLALFQPQLSGGSD
jgi:hypothetical protein